MPETLLCNDPKFLLLAVIFLIGNNQFLAQSFNERGDAHVREIELIVDHHKHHFVFYPPPMRPPGRARRFSKPIPEKRTRPNRAMRVPCYGYLRIYLALEIFNDVVKCVLFLVVSTGKMADDTDPFLMKADRVISHGKLRFYLIFGKLQIRAAKIWDGSGRYDQSPVRRDRVRAFTETFTPKQ